MDTSGSNREYLWVRRHTMHSWRERYRNHQAEFDERIDHIAFGLAPTASEHVVYHRDRRIRRARQGYCSPAVGLDATSPRFSNPENESNQGGSGEDHPNSHSLEALLDDPSLLQIRQNK
jgi:hypothetical protein